MQLLCNEIQERGENSDTGFKFDSKVAGMLVELLTVGIVSS